VSERTLDNISWFVDEQARRRNEPGIRHSYIASLASAVQHVQGSLDPAWLMGATGFAFRTFINEVLCPSAMSIFNWAKILPEAVEQSGYHCTYISRMWEEADRQEEGRQKAHAAILEAIERGTPAIAWDVADCEWGLIIGYDDELQSYRVLDHRGKHCTLNYEQLGQRAIKILSVTIPGPANGRDRKQILHNALRTAVAHASQQEWTDRPKYENGLAAYEMWASALEKWAAILPAGAKEKTRLDVSSFATHYADHHYSARCYAREFLKSVESTSTDLQEALLSYKEVASQLKSVWDFFSGVDEPAPPVLASLAEDIRGAKAAEMRGIDAIKRYLSHSS
jgi:hypothetical protein